MWTGVSLGITPAMTAVLAPAWGRLGDRFGRKIMVERSLVSFVVLFAAMAFISRAWQVLAEAHASYAIVHEAFYAGDRGARMSAWLRSRGAHELEAFGADRIFQMP